MEAWGIFFATFTMLGMLGLWIALDRIGGSEPATTAHAGDEPVEPVELKKAA